MTEMFIALGALTEFTSFIVNTFKKKKYYNLTHIIPK